MYILAEEKTALSSPFGYYRAFFSKKKTKS